MIVVSNRIQVAKGHEEEFEARFEGRARLVENMPGFVRLEILRPINSDYYVVLRIGKTKAHSALGPTARNLKKLTAIGRRLRYSPARMFLRCTRSSSTQKKAISQSCRYLIYLQPPSKSIEAIEVV